LIKNQTYFGLCANPFEKITGVGRILEGICVKHVFELLKLNELKLEVFDRDLCKKPPI
jgi:hypothetical protein